jgi:chromosomal replication initiation ATPase DnaA
VRLRSLRSLRRTSRPTNNHHRRSPTEYPDNDHDDGAFQLINTVHEIGSGPMYASLADRSTRKLLNRLVSVDVLLIDEMGYLNLKPEQTNIFFKLMEERYRRRPTIITTNLEYEAWGSFLGNKALVEALLSRLRHQCHTVKIDGPTLRDSTG